MVLDIEFPKSINICFMHGFVGKEWISWIHLNFSLFARPYFFEVIFFFYSLSFQKDHLFQKSHYTLFQFSFKSIQDGPFWSCSQIGESVQKAPSSPYLNLSYIIFNNDQTWPSYTLSKEDPKIHKSHETAFELCWHQHFPTEFNTFCYIRK